MLETIEVQVKLKPGALVPAIAKVGDAAADLRALTRYNVEDDTHTPIPAGGVIIPPGCRRMFGTGVSLSLPAGFRARVCSRSGLSAKWGVEVGAGLIDNGYLGELCAVLHNHGDQGVVIKQGDRIAQMCIERYTQPVFVVVEDFERQTERGATGYGSTGGFANADI